VIGSNGWSAFVLRPPFGATVRMTRLRAGPAVTIHRLSADASERLGCPLVNGKAVLRRFLHRSPACCPRRLEWPVIPGRGARRIPPTRHTRHVTQRAQCAAKGWPAAGFAAAGGAPKKDRRDRETTSMAGALPVGRARRRSHGSGRATRPPAVRPAREAGRA